MRHTTSAATSTSDHSQQAPALNTAKQPEPRRLPGAMRTPLALLALAVLAACSSLPDRNANLDEARSSLQTAQSDLRTQGLAGAELQAATTALAAAEAAHARGDDSVTVDHLAYLARQRVRLLEEAGQKRAAEAAVADAQRLRDQLRLAARTQEADAAKGSAQTAQRDAQAAQRDTQAAQRDTLAAQRSNQQAQLAAGQSRQQATEADTRAALLAQQLQTLQAKPTERGMVVTIGDVLFDTDRSQVKASGLGSMEKLVAFLKANPERRALVEGYTDSMGNDAYNQALSDRRAEAVRGALVTMGVASDRLSAKGLGEAYPVASNDSASGRQMNRRVEIVLSNEQGNISGR
jgi:outer membrane protein OmpA-like peptidoglycan-associated protein